MIVQQTKSVILAFTYLKVVSRVIELYTLFKLVNFLSKTVILQLKVDISNMILQPGHVLNAVANFKNCTND